MRISSFHLSSTMFQNINSYSGQLNKLTEQMALRKRVIVPSDDPIASSRLVLINREQSAIDQYQSNITRLSGSLSQQEAHLDSVSKQLLAMRDKVLLANNGTGSAGDINGYGSELEAMLESIVSTMNNKNEDGRYLFSGTATDTQPIVFDAASGQYVYQGNTNQRETVVGSGVSVKENSNAGDIFFNGSNDLLNDLNELVGMMKDPNTDFTSPAYTDALNNMISTIDSSIDSVASTMTDLGGRQNAITMMDEAHSDVKIANELVQKELSDLDYATAAIELEGFLVAAKASQSTFVKISSLSLFDMIK
jgi:flagellar hook-associated protein 3 FlgL